MWYLAESINRRGAHPPKKLNSPVDAVVVGRGPPTGGNDLVDDQLGGRGRRAAAVEGATEVIDQNRGAATSQLDRVGRTEAATPAGDDGYSSVEAHVRATH
jgi:hypothetical protein